jgi:hypothetical protein
VVAAADAHAGSAAAAGAERRLVRLREIGDAQQRLLRALTQRISTRLDAEFTEPVGAQSPNIGIALSERGRSGTLEVPAALLLRADAEADAREALRQRIKATRDRMLFRAPPPPLPRNIAAAGDPVFFRSRGPGPGRGRR